MSKSNRRKYDFTCQCSYEFSAFMWSKDVNYDGVYVPEGVKCPKCDTLTFPPEGTRLGPDSGHNMVSDKDIRTGNWVNKLPEDWKYIHNKIADKNKSSLTTMEKI